MTNKIKCQNNSPLICWKDVKENVSLKFQIKLGCTEEKLQKFVLFYFKFD